VIVAYVDASKASFGVEPICRVLNQIAPAPNFAFKKRLPSARSLSDQRLLTEVRGVFYANYACYGVRDAGALLGASDSRFSRNDNRDKEILDRTRAILETLGDG